MEDGRLRFEVEGSKDDLYVIEAERIDADHFWMSCTCPAGGEDRLCRHRLDLLRGVIDDLVSGNADDVALLKTLIEGSAVERALGVVAEAEAVADIAKAEAVRVGKAVAAAKSRLRRLLNGMPEALAGPEDEQRAYLRSIGDL